MDDALIQFELKIKMVCDELDKIHDLHKNPLDENEVREIIMQEKPLLLQLDRIFAERKMYTNGLTEEVIKMFADIDAREEMMRKPPKENEYNLSSQYIISNKDGSRINVGYLPPFEKIEVIYENTGEIMNVNDSVLHSGMLNRFDAFIKEILSKEQAEKYIEKYGENWKDKLFELYSEGYVNSTKKQIEEIVSSVDERNKMNVQQSKPDEKITPELENEQLKNKIAELEMLIGNMREENKETLETVKNSFLQLSSEKQKDDFEFTFDEKTAMLNAVGIQLSVVEDKKRNTFGFSLIQDADEPMEVTARKMMICKWFDIETKGVVNGLEVNNKDFDNAQEIIEKGANSHTPVTVPAQNKAI